MQKESKLRLKYLGIDTYKEFVVYLRSDCHICCAQGFDAAERVLVTLGNNSIIATLNMVTNGILAQGEASLSIPAWEKLGASAGDTIKLSYPSPVSSLSYVRKKLFNQTLTKKECYSIIHDITQGLFTDVQISAFVAACAAGKLDWSIRGRLSSVFYSSLHIFY